MKRFRNSLIIYGICVLCLFSACGKEEEPAETDWNELQMAQAVWLTQEDLAYEALVYGGADFAGYLADVYGLDPSGVSEARSSMPGASPPGRSPCCALRTRKPRPGRRRL